MTATKNPDYFLFPHMTLPASLLKNFSVFLPHLNVLEIIGKTSVPEWAHDWLKGRPAIDDSELSARIKAALGGYRDFAEVRGGPGGVLGFLKQALDEIDEPRYKIQEELRGKSDPKGEDAGETRIVQDSLFLEMSRELDEKELEIQDGYDRMDEIEQEFRDILGIEDEDCEEMKTDLLSALVYDENSLLFMLEKRIESWFRIFMQRPLASMPVFVAGYPEVVLEALDLLRTGCERSGQEFSTAVYTLGPLPASGVVWSGKDGLDDFLRSAALGEEPEVLEEKRLVLQNGFNKLCNGSDSGMSLLITVVKNVSVGAIPGLPAMPPSGEAGTWPPIFLSIEIG